MANRDVRSNTLPLNGSDEFLFNTQLKIRKTRNALVATWSGAASARISASRLSPFDLAGRTGFGG
jgi:hypothetical protein